MLRGPGAKRGAAWHLVMNNFISSTLAESSLWLAKSSLRKATCEKWTCEKLLAKRELTHFSISAIKALPLKNYQKMTENLIGSTKGLPRRGGSKLEISKKSLYSLPLPNVFIFSSKFRHDRRGGGGLALPWPPPSLKYAYGRDILFH